MMHKFNGYNHINMTKQRRNWELNNCSYHLLTNISHTYTYHELVLIDLYVLDGDAAAKHIWHKVIVTFIVRLKYIIS